MTYIEDGKPRTAPTPKEEMRMGRIKHLEDVVRLLRLELSQRGVLTLEMTGEDITGPCQPPMMCTNHEHAEIMSKLGRCNWMCNCFCHGTGFAGDISKHVCGE